MEYKYHYNLAYRCVLFPLLLHSDVMATNPVEWDGKNKEMLLMYKQVSRMAFRSMGRGCTK
jgi:hypothetical protein